MPSVVLEDANPFGAEPLAVVGEYATDGRLVRHAALLSISMPLKRGSEPAVHQMCPPLALDPMIGEAQHAVGNFHPVHIVGYVEGLTRSDVKAMETWLARISRRTPVIPRLRRGWDDRYLEHYILCPPVQPAAVDKKTGNPRFWRFSCVGLVLECYRHGAKINLLDWESPRFPRIHLRDFKDAYGEDMILAPRNLAKVGLSGQGPWPIALPGYLFHALHNRTAAAIRSEPPYLPTSTNETRFP